MDHDEEIYNSGTSNLSDDVRKIIVFFSTEALPYALWTLSPCKSDLAN